MEVAHHCAIKRKCRICKTAFMRKARAAGKYRKRERKYNQKVKNWLMMKAKRIVFIEVRAGRLPKASEFVCFDCGNAATCYDHRDYKKPLDIEPVCGSCNKYRGPGKNREGKA